MSWLYLQSPNNHYVTCMLCSFFKFPSYTYTIHNSPDTIQPYQIIALTSAMSSYFMCKMPTYVESFHRTLYVLHKNIITMLQASKNHLVCWATVEYAKVTHSLPSRSCDEYIMFCCTDVSLYPPFSVFLPNTLHSRSLCFIITHQILSVSEQVYLTMLLYQQSI